MNSLVGQTLDEKYLVTRSLGAGGMGEVFEATQLALDRSVAIKVLLEATQDHDESIKRFHREAKAAAAIGHPNIIQIFDVGTLENGAPYIVMEYLSGESLASHLLNEELLGFAEATHVVVPVLSALAATHQKGILHRDLKPDNIFLAQQPMAEPKPVLLDFGTSKLPDVWAGTKLTTTGVAMGTPHYMAPEQATGESDLDHRVDIYAVGVILYECVTGQMPFHGDNYNQLVFRIATEMPPLPRSICHAIPPEFEAIVVKAMAKDPEQRYQHAQDMAEALVLHTHGTGLSSGVWAMASGPQTTTGASPSGAQPLATPQSPSGAASSPGLIGPFPGGQPTTGFLSTTGPQASEPRPTTSPHSQTGVVPASAASKPIATPMAWSPTTDTAGSKTRRGWLLPVAGGAAIALIVAIVGVFALGGGSGSGKSDSPAKPATGDITAPDTTPMSGAMNPVEQIPVRIRVTPKKAWIYLDGKLLPGNPYVAKLPKSSDRVTLLVRADGYEDHRETVSLAAALDRSVALKKLTGRATRRGRRAVSHSREPRKSAPRVAEPLPVAPPRAEPRPAPRRVRVRISRIRPATRPARRPAMRTAKRPAPRRANTGQKDKPTVDTDVPF